MDLGLRDKVAVITGGSVGIGLAVAKGLAADANNVADYLDSTLPSERVGDFERVCLDSDMHLAEVASCHQILTLVVSKPAEVSDSLRQKIYAVGQVARLVNKSLANGHTAEKAPLQRGAAGTIPVAPKEQVATEATATSAAIVASSSNVAADLTTEKTVPSYLRTESPPRLWPSLLGLAAGILIVAGILRAMGPFNAGHPVLGALLKPRELAQTNVTNEPKESATTSPTAPTTKETKEPESSPEQNPAETKPAADEAGFESGAALGPMVVTAELRPYQRDAVTAWWRDGDPSGGSGVVVLPCGAGKTVVGLAVVAATSAHTLVVCTSISPVVGASRPARSESSVDLPLPD